jgi:hypothetical protein
MLVVVVEELDLMDLVVVTEVAHLVVNLEAVVVLAVEVEMVAMDHPVEMGNLDHLDLVVSKGQHIKQDNLFRIGEVKEIGELEGRDMVVGRGVEGDQNRIGKVIRVGVLTEQGELKETGGIVLADLVVPVVLVVTAAVVDMVVLVAAVAAVVPVVHLVTTALEAVVVNSV